MLETTHLYRHLCFETGSQYLNGTSLSLRYGNMSKMCLMVIFLWTAFSNVNEYFPRLRGCFVAVCLWYIALNPWYLFEACRCYHKTNTLSDLASGRFSLQNSSVKISIFLCLFSCADWEFVLVLYGGKSEEGIWILPANAGTNLNLLAIPIFPVLVS